MIVVKFCLYSPSWGIGIGSADKRYCGEYGFRVNKHVLNFNICHKRAFQVTWNVVSWLPSSLRQVSNPTWTDPQNMRYLNSPLIIVLQSSSPEIVFTDYKEVEYFPRYIWYYLFNDLCNRGLLFYILFKERVDKGCGSVVFIAQSTWI